MSPHEFDRLVSAAYAGIPGRFRKRLKNVALIVEPEPSAAQLASGHVPRGSTLLGLYEGRAWWPTPCGTKWRTTLAWTNSRCARPKGSAGSGGEGNARTLNAYSETYSLPRRLWVKGRGSLPFARLFGLGAAAAQKNEDPENHHQGRANQTKS